MEKGNRSKRRERKDRQRREEEDAIEAVEETRKLRNSRWLYLCGHVWAAAMVSGIIGITYSKLSKKPDKPHFKKSGLEKKVEEIIEKPIEASKDSVEVPGRITFEQARANKEDHDLVQKYLDQILERTETVGVEGWDSLGELVYDPGFKKRGKVVGGEKGRYLDEAGYGENSSGVSLMCTMTGRSRKGKKGLMYINSTAFEFCRSEDELLSGLDNEIFTARALHKGDAHITTISRPNPAIGEMSKALFHLQCEALSFDLQFTYIENGKRKVSDFFLEGARSSARGLIKKLFEIAESGTVDGEYAQGILATLGRRPTIKYFMPNLKK
ncbi:unnamed protein product [marine sediment metagenome]|uniref:Uncharacterized protein n=1 Tax=marine sediment metagenome TaxID=412755 RepID=X0RRD1_9ZZZZ